MASFNFYSIRFFPRIYHFQPLSAHISVYFKSRNSRNKPFLVCWKSQPGLLSQWLLSYLSMPFQQLLVVCQEPKILHQVLPRLSKVSAFANTLSYAKTLGFCNKSPSVKVPAFATNNINGPSLHNNTCFECRKSELLHKQSIVYRKSQLSQTTNCPLPVRSPSNCCPNRGPRLDRSFGGKLSCQDILDGWKANDVSFSILFTKLKCF